MEENDDIFGYKRPDQSDVPTEKHILTVDHLAESLTAAYEELNAAIAANDLEHMERAAKAGLALIQQNPELDDAPLYLPEFQFAMVRVAYRRALCRFHDIDHQQPDAQTIARQEAFKILQPYLSLLQELEPEKIRAANAEHILGQVGLLRDKLLPAVLLPPRKKK